MKCLKYARGLVVLGVAMMLVAFAPSEWVQAAGLDVWNMPKLQEEIAENQRLSALMDDDARIMHQRITVKDQLVKELIEGRTDLATVTEQFHELNDAEVNGHLRGYYHLEDERELAALNVLAFAETTLDNEPKLKPAVMHRLDREFSALFPEPDGE